MRTFYKLSILIVLALTLSLGTEAAYGASIFPEKPVTMVVHAAPGSGIDMLGRFIAAVFEKHKLLPHPIVVENKTGGSGAIAMAYVAGKKKDPYYILGVTTLFILTPLQGNSPFNYKDFTPICNLSYDDHMLMVNINSKFKTIKEVVDYAKAYPEKVTVGGAATGGVESVNNYRFEKAAGIKLKWVGFSGGSEAITSLLGGHIDMASGNPIEVMELVKGNKVRVLGALTEKRLPYLPNIPTIMEQGINTTGAGMWRGIVGPGGIPEDARKVLEEAFSKFAKSEEFKKFHMDNMIGEGWLDGAGFRKYLDQKNEIFATILKDMGILKK